MNSSSKIKNDAPRPKVTKPARTAQNDTKPRRHCPRSGISTIDYVLILAVILPLVAFLFTIVPRMIQLVYEMTIVVIGTPIM